MELVYDSHTLVQEILPHLKRLDITEFLSMNLVKHEKIRKMYRIIFDKLTFQNILCDIYTRRGKFYVFFMTWI